MNGLILVLIFFSGVCGGWVARAAWESGRTEKRLECIRELRSATLTLLDYYFPDLCFGQCEHIDCADARKGKIKAEAILTKSKELLKGER